MGARAVPALLSVLLLAATAPALAQLTPDESSELDRLRGHEQDLSAIAGRAESGEIALLPNPRATGSPWLEVPRGDPSSMIASLVLTGDLTAAEAADMARDIGRNLREGRARLDAELAKVRGRIRTLESRDLAPGGRLASGDPHEKWRFAMVGRFARTGSPLNSTGVLDLDFKGGGRVYGRAHYDSKDSWDDTVEGTIANGQVRIEYGASNSVTRGVFTGAIDPSGTAASGEFRISGSIDAAGAWRATRLAATPATPAAPSTPTAGPGPSGGAAAPRTADAVEDSLVAALAGNTGQDFLPLLRNGMISVEPDAYWRQRRENRDRAAREIFGRDFAGLGEADRSVANLYGIGMDLAMLQDRSGARAFSGVAASLPVIGAMAHNAAHDPAAAVALRRYVALLERMDVNDLRQRSGATNVP